MRRNRDTLFKSFLWELLIMAKRAIPAQVSAKPERDYRFDNMKALLIFLVVFGHLLEPYRQTGTIIAIAYSVIYIFHIPLFVFISGYFSKNAAKARKNAFADLLLPYLIFNTLYGLLFIPFSEVSPFFPEYVYWYLLSLFFWRIMLDSLVKIRFVLVLSIFVALLCGFLRGFGGILALSRTIVFLPFFLMGYFFDEKMKHRLAAYPKPIAAAVFAIVCAVAGFASGTQLYLHSLLHTTEKYMPSSFVLSKPLLLLTAYVLAFVGGISLLRIVPDRPLFFTYFGNSTLPVLLLHPYFIFAVTKLDQYFTVISTTLPIVQFGVLAVLAALAVLLLGNRFINKWFSQGLNFLKKIICKPDS